MIKLIHGDCLEKMDKLIAEGVKVDAIITDPPYGIITGGDKDGVNSKRPSGIMTKNKELMKSIPNFDVWLPKCYELAKEETQHYFMVNFKNLYKLMGSVEKAGFTIQNLLVWEKNNCTPSQYYMKNCEYVIFARKGKAKYINDIGGSKTVHKVNNICGNKIHPTEKPVVLMEFYINNSTNRKDTILDPFMGSGSTAIACINTNRNFIGIEKDAHYFQVGKDRVEKYLITLDYNPEIVCYQV
jgi:DNA modification methylase